MKLQQLHYLCTIVDHDLNLSSAAAALQRSQPGVSRAIKLLEDELGTLIFLRKGKRLVEITPAGIAVVQAARSMLANEKAIRKIGSEFAPGEKGQLVVGTTHTNARYGLPSTIRTFASRFPHVRLVLREGTAEQIANWVSEGAVDITVGAKSASAASNLVFMPCYPLNRLVLTKPDHDLLKMKKVTLEAIVQYPIVAYHSMADRLSQSFEGRDLHPNIVLSAEDVDVMKTYLRLGLGIAISPHIAFDPKHDHDLRAIPVGHLFAPTMICVGLSAESHLPNYAFEFIQMLNPKLKRSAVEREQMMARGRGSSRRHGPLVAVPA